MPPVTQALDQYLLLTTRSALAPRVANSISPAKQALRAMSKLYACIISADAKNDKAVLLSIADEFASGIEMLEDGVLFNVSGLEKLMGDADEIARRIEEKLKHHDLQANAAVAASADTAILLARQNEHLERTAKANEFSRLALKELGIDPDTLDIFDDLGIRKISDLRRVPVDDLINRYGQKFRD